jgi:hypothetical protein
LESDWLASDEPGRMLAWLTGGYQDGSTATENARRLATPRKLRLFACACSRSVWHLLTDPRSRRAVEVAELYADGEVGASELRSADTSQVGVGLRVVDHDTPASLAWLSCWGDGMIGKAANIIANHRIPEPSVQAGLLRDIVGNHFRPVTLPGPPCPDCAPGEPEEDCDDCGGTGTVLGPCPWLTPQVVALAKAAYDDRGGEACGRCGGKWKTVQGWTTVEIGGHWTKCPDCAGTGRVTTTGHLDPAALAVLADALEEGGATDAQLLGHLRSPGPHVRGCVAADLILGKA